MRRSAFIFLHRGVCSGALALALAGAASAQTVPAAPPADAAAPVPAGNEATGQEIIVTGTRIAGGFQTPTPVTVLTNERSKSLGHHQRRRRAEPASRLPPDRSGPRRRPISAAMSVRACSICAGSSRSALWCWSMATASCRPRHRAEYRRGRRQSDPVGAGRADRHRHRRCVGRLRIGRGRGRGQLRAQPQAHRAQGRGQGGISQRGDNSGQYPVGAGGTQLGDRVHVIGAGEYDENGGLAIATAARGAATSIRSSPTPPAAPTGCRQT
jgi:iron complex outermembrane receptor protein